MKLWFALALVLLMGKGASQEAGKEVVVPVPVPVAAGKNPFADPRHFLGGSKPPMLLYSSNGALWELATKVAAGPPKHLPGVGIGIGGPVAVLQIVKPAGVNESGFKIAIFPRTGDDGTGLMGIRRVTTLEDHVTEERYLGWFDDKVLRALCEEEGMQSLAKLAAGKPLQAFSMIGPKEGSPGVWVEKLFVVNVSDRALRIDKVFFEVWKAGTTEKLREVEVMWPPEMKRVDGKKQIELLPQRSWLALSTEWDALPDLAAQSGSAGMRISGEPVGESVIRAEVNRYIEAEVKRE
jgi:hypothetical protein